MVATRHSARYLTALLLTPLLLLSGCGKFNAGFVIKDENHVDATFTVGVLKSVLDEFAGSEAEEVTKELRDCSELKKSYELDESTADTMTVKPFDDDNYLGCTVTGTMTVAEPTGQSPSSSSSVKPSATPAKGLAGDAPIFIAFDDDRVRFRFDGSDLHDAISGFGSSELGSSARAFDFKVSVTFPGKVLSHSGSSEVDGKTVTWTDIEDLESYSGLEASGERGGGFPGWAWVVLAVVVVAIGGAIVAVAMNKGKGGRQAGVPHQADTPNQQPGMPSPMGGQPQGPWNPQQGDGHPRRLCPPQQYPQQPPQGRPGPQPRQPYPPRGPQNPSPGPVQGGRRPPNAPDVEPGPNSH